MMNVESLENQEIDEGFRDNMYMSFKSGDEYFALKISYVYEIFGFEQLAASLEGDSYIKGVINRRNKTIPVIDIRIRFGQDSINYTDKTYIIVVDTKNALYGLIVDKVTGVIIIDDRNIFAFPPIGNKENVINKYLYGVCKINNQIKMLINPDTLINNEDITTFEEMLEEKAESNEPLKKRRKKIKRFRREYRNNIKKNRRKQKKLIGRDRRNRSKNKRKNRIRKYRISKKSSRI